MSVAHLRPAQPEPNLRTIPHRRNNRASITTGIVERSVECLRQDEAADRLSPLTSSISNTFITFPSAADPENDLERFCDMDIDPSSSGPNTASGSADGLQRPIDPGATMMDDDAVSAGVAVASAAAAAAAAEAAIANASAYSSRIPNQVDYQHHQPQQPHYYHTTVASSACTAAAIASTNAARRHTVGPGDANTYEQSLYHPPINFKFGDASMAADATNATTHAHLLPTNLPMLQNQPLHNFGVKNHHLLKPPTVMENSKWCRRVIECVPVNNAILHFGRRFVWTPGLGWWRQPANLLSDIVQRHWGQCSSRWRCRWQPFGGKRGRWIRHAGSVVDRWRDNRWGE